MVTEIIEPWEEEGELTQMEIDIEKLKIRRLMDDVSEHKRPKHELENLYY